MKQILTVWKKELKDTIRDRRTLVVSIIMPILFMPLMMVGSFKIQEAQIKSAEEQISVVAIENEAEVPTLSGFLVHQEKVEIKEFTGDREEMINSGEVHVVLSAAEGFEEKINNSGLAEVVIYSKSTETKSQVTAGKIYNLLYVLNQSVSNQRLIEENVDPNLILSVDVAREDIATSQEKGGFFLGLLLPMFIVLFSFIGGMYIAIDISAGEKERKTLEALLLTPLSKMKIVSGKFLAVATTSITSVVLSVSSLYVAFKIWTPDFGNDFSGLEFNIDAKTMLIMLGIGVILSIMFAGMLLAVAIFAKSYKEAQNYVMPFYIVTILPVAILGSFPGFKPNLAFFFIPAVNAVLLFKENLLGVFEPSHIIATLASLIFFAFVSIFISSKIYSKESILFRD